jgi:hypothetical protein
MIVPTTALTYDDPSTEPTDAMITAIDAYDLDASATLFSDDAVVMQPHMGGLPEMYVGSAQIRWWLRNLFAQHVHLAMRGGPRADSGHILFSELLAVDAYRQLGLAEVEVESDVVLAPDFRISSLTTTLSPDTARRIQGAPAFGPAVSASGSPPVHVDVSDASGVLLAAISFLLGVAAATLALRLTRGLVDDIQGSVGALLGRARRRRA